MMSRSSGRRDERGIVLIVVAVAMVAVLIIVALVLDLSLVRQSRQANKSAADQAVAAGLRGLEDKAVGVPKPWQGVCQAIEYLKANDPELAGLTGNYKDGDGTPISSDPCTALASMPNCDYTDIATPATLDTWAWFEGSADGGRINVEIKSGYLTPDPDFPEDNNPSYVADNGNPLFGGCDQMAVIVRERESDYFGRIVRSGGYETVTRSVGRVYISGLPTEAVALLLLELKDCGTLVTSGMSTSVLVRATGVDDPLTPQDDRNPGLIHANSNGSGDCSGGARVIEGNNGCWALDPDSDCNPTGPSIIAEGVSGGRPGVIRTPAVTANPGSAHTPACPDPNSYPGTCTIAPVPITRGTMTRAPVDDRYLAHATNLKAEAATEYGRSNDSAASEDYAVYGTGTPSLGTCASLENKTISATLPAGPAVVNTGGLTKVFLNCDVDLAGGESMVFDDTVTDVVIDGEVDIKGVLDLRNVRRFYVNGDNGTGPVNGVKVSGQLLVNTRGAPETATKSVCENRYDNSPVTEITKFVVGNGPLDGNAAGTVVRLCNTFVLLGGGQPLPTTPGMPAANNASNGRIIVGSSTTLDWKAPNQSTASPLADTDPLMADFEDLALWSEFSGNGTPGNAPGIGGQGRVTMTGIFFMPNANPFNISGGGFGIGVPLDAQFVVRKLRLSGTTTLNMAPDPNNAVRTPTFDDFVLIR